MSQKYLTGFSVIVKSTPKLTTLVPKIIGKHGPTYFFFRDSILH